PISFSGRIWILDRRARTLESRAMEKKSGLSIVEGLRLKNRLAAGALPECPRINARSFMSASCAVSETCTWSSSKETGGRSFHTLTEAGSMPGYQGVSKDRSAHQ